jgi:fermentation-respiration switch protein FrsA (DUF1100 family)
VALGVVAFYVLLVAAVFFMQRSLLYFPSQDPAPTPAGIDDIELTTSDNLRLRAWVGSEAREGAVLMFHGNGGDRSSYAGTFAGFARLGLRPLLIDYRGYGGSEGEPTEEGLYNDAEAALAWLREQGARKVVLWGYSLGSGVAVELARRHEIAGVILDAPFDSAVAVAKEVYPALPVGLLMLDRYASIDKIADIGCPLLVFHGDADQVVPLAHGRRLFEAAREPKRWVLVPGGGHDDLRLVAGANYWSVVDEFLKRVTAAPP